MATPAIIFRKLAAGTLCALMAAGFLAAPGALSAQEGQQAQQPRTQQQRPQQQQQRPQGQQQQRRPGQQQQQRQQRQQPAQGGTRTLGEFGQFSLDRESRLLRIHPEGLSDRQDYTVIVGEEFVTEISLSNRQLIPFNQIRVLLSYEPDFLEPVAVNDTPISNYLEEDPTAEVDPLWGILLYEAVLARPMAVNDAPILSVRWKAKRVNTESHIVFGSRDDAYTALMFDNTLILGHPDDPTDGTLDMTVTILPEDPREAEALLTDPRMYVARDQKVGGVRLFLRPQPEPVVVGEPFFFDIVLDNRAFSLMDSLGVLLSFDPEKIEVLDADYNNWMTRGVNIHDGPYRNTFPWNYHVENTVMNNQGLISYRKGTDDDGMTRGKIGTVARIYAIGKRPTAGTPIVFQFNESPRGRGTKATYMGSDALGDPNEFADGAQGLILTIHPRSNVQLTNAERPSPQGGREY